MIDYVSIKKTNTTRLYKLPLQMCRLKICFIYILFPLEIEFRGLKQLLNTSCCILKKPTNVAKIYIIDSELYCLDQF